MECAESTNQRGSNGRTSIAEFPGTMLLSWTVAAALFFRLIKCSSSLRPLLKYSLENCQALGSDFLKFCMVPNTNFHYSSHTGTLSE